MADTLAPRIFLSYARADRNFAVEFREGIEAELGQGTVWHDLKDLEAGQWWSQIAGALNGERVEHVVLIATPAALASHPVADEIWLAQREGKSACIVLPPYLEGRLDRSKLPRWLGAEEHFNLAENGRKAALIGVLARPGQGPRRPRPEGRSVPESYVPREAEYGALKGALLDADKEATTAIVVLRGPGGFGKTTLATALVNDETVQQAYFNGILLVELGEGLTRLPKTYDGRKLLESMIKGKIEALIKTLTGKNELLDELDAAKSRLKEVLDHRHGAVLLWIDDAWAEEHVRHFIDAAPNAATLVTTRIMDMLPDAEAHVDVDELTEPEALAFMRWRLPDLTDAEKTGLRELATVTAGRWPLLIRQINAQLRQMTTARGGAGAQPLGRAIEALHARLKREGLDDLDKSRSNDRATAVRLSVGVSFELLRAEDAHRGVGNGFHEARYIDLAGFQEAELPIASIARFWGHLGVLRAEAPRLDVGDGEHRAEQERRWRAELRAESIDILERLYALALLQKLDMADDDGTVRLHEVMRQYLADKQKEALAAFHKQFVLAYDAESGKTVSNMTARERRYFYTWFPTHLHEAGEREALDTLLIDPQWMQRKLCCLGDIQSLIKDYHIDPHSLSDLASHIGQVLHLCEGILSRHSSQLLPQLIARLDSKRSEVAHAYLGNLRGQVVGPCLVPEHSILAESNFERQRLEFHTNSIWGLHEMPDGKLVSVSVDGYLGVWNLDEGKPEIVKLKEDTPYASVVLSECIVAVAGERRRIELVDVNKLQTSIEMIGTDDHVGTAVIAIDSLSIASLSIDTNGAILSASLDYTLRAWTPGKSPEILSFEPFDDYNSGQGMLWSVCCVADGIAVGSESGDIRIFDRVHHRLITTLTGHKQRVRPIISLRDGRIASASTDGTVRIWNIASGKEEQRFSLHTSAVLSLHELSNGHIASGSFDGRLRIWNPRRDEQVAALRHPGWVTSIIELKDGNVASGCLDGTIRIWNLKHVNGSAPRRRHDAQVSGVSAQFDGIVVSGDYKGQLSIWNTATKEKIGGTKIPNMISPSIRFLGGSRSGELLVGGAGKCLKFKLPKPVDRIFVDWRKQDEFPLIYTGGFGQARYLINKADVDVRGRNVGCGQFADRAVFFGDLGDYVADSRIWLWLQDGIEEPAHLCGHSAQVTDVRFLADGVLVSASLDGSIRVWNIDQHVELADPLICGSGVTALCELSGGRLACGLVDGSINIWNLRDGGIDTTLRNMNWCIDRIISINDNLLATAGTDNIVELWDVILCKSVATLELDGWVSCLGYLENENVILAGDATGQLHWLSILV